MTTPIITGLLNINKPIGITSMDVVREIKKSTGIKKVGHGGTLDPMASGVIPIAIGTSTRLLEYILNGDKSYIATIELGRRTDTYDSEGKTVEKSDPRGISIDEILKVLSKFNGEMTQIPPMHSALKVQGKRLYELARSGTVIERPPRNVTIYEVSLEEFNTPNIVVGVRCSKGFYVRTVADDIGVLLGCGAFLSSLKRVSSGPFKIEDAMTLDQTISMILDGNLQELILDPGSCINGAQRIQLNEATETMVKHGRAIGSINESFPITDSSLAVAYDNQSRFVAVLRFNEKLQEWHPEKVFNTDISHNN